MNNNHNNNNNNHIHKSKPMLSDRFHKSRKHLYNNLNNNNNNNLKKCQIFLMTNWMGLGW